MRPLFVSALVVAILVLVSPADIAAQSPPARIVILDSGKIEGIDSTTTAMRGTRSSRTFFPRGKCSPSRACLPGTALALTTLAPMGPRIVGTDSVGVRLLIENRGQARVPATEVEVRDALSAERYPVPTLDGGEAFEIVVRARGPRIGRDISCPFAIIASVDPDHMLHETARVEKSLTARLDCESMSLGIIDFQMSPIVRFPDPVLVAVTVRNNSGVGETPDTELLLSINDGNPGSCDGKAFALVRIPTLGARQRTTIRAKFFPWTFNCNMTSNEFVVVRIDPLNAFNWSGSTTTSLSRMITVTP